MKDDMHADLAYFKALENAKKLHDQVDYFSRKETPRRNDMVELAMEILVAHMKLVDAMRKDYMVRKEKLMEKAL